MDMLWPSGRACTMSALYSPHTLRRCTRPVSLPPYRLHNTPPMHQYTMSYLCLAGTCRPNMVYVPGYRCCTNMSWHCLGNSIPPYTPNTMLPWLGHTDRLHRQYRLSTYMHLTWLLRRHQHYPHCYLRYIPPYTYMLWTYYPQTCWN